MQKVIIFDLDGTVIDSIYDITDSMNKMLVNHGFKEISIENMKKGLGGSSIDIVRNAINADISKDLLNECTLEYTKNYIDGGCPKTVVFEGMDKVIFELKKRDYKICALSNKPDDEIQPIFDRVLKPLGFDMVCGLSEKIIPKPNPQGALYILNQMNASVENSYLVGDGETDVLTALNAKIKFIGVLWGNRDKEFLQGYGAKVFAKTPKELLSLID